MRFAEMKMTSCESSLLKTVINCKLLIVNCKIGTKHAAEDAGEVGMMAESVAMDDGKAPRKSRNANGLARSVGGANWWRESLAGQWRCRIENLQMATQ